MKKLPISSGKHVLKTAHNIESLMEMREKIFNIKNEQYYNLMPVTTEKKKQILWNKLNVCMKNLEYVSNLINNEMPKNFTGIKELREGKHKYSE